MKIGVFAASSQSGRAYLADFANQGHSVYGYCRPSEHGKQFISAIKENKGILLKRPKENKNKENPCILIPLENFRIGSSLEELIEHSEIIIMAEPSIYFLESIISLEKAGISKKKIPIILSPCRTMLVPQLWKVLGEGYPFVCFSTCAYSCKAPEDAVSYIKRRKRVWIASLEGDIGEKDFSKLELLFPQCIWSRIPAVTSLGNIGMVFHPATYLLNYEAIVQAEKAGQDYSFYMEGIANAPQVGITLEKIDAIRLEIARQIGIKVLQPGKATDESEWNAIMDELYTHEKNWEQNIVKLRAVRREHLSKISSMVVGTQFWLDYTYGVKRIVNEPLYKAIGRTPTYQKMSVAQKRYIEEDVPTGLLPLYKLGKYFKLDVSILEELLQKYCNIENKNFTDFIDAYGEITEGIINYLRGSENS